MTTGRELWDAEAESFDEEPDHGLADPACRAAWRDLLRRGAAEVAEPGSANAEGGLQA